MPAAEALGLTDGHTPRVHHRQRPRVGSYREVLLIAGVLHAQLCLGLLQQQPVTLRSITELKASSCPEGVK